MTAKTIANALGGHKALGRAEAKHTRAIRSRRLDDNETEFFTIAQVAEFIGVSERTVQRWIRSGAVPVHRFGRLVRISDADISAFLAATRSVTY